MKLLKFMEVLVSTHKKFSEEVKSYSSANYKMEIGIGGVDIMRKQFVDGHVAYYSVFAMNTVNTPTSHTNNAKFFAGGGISSFFRASSEGFFHVQDKSGPFQVLPLPIFNDNEEELLFTLDTITSCSIPMVLAAILMTLDTKLASMYTYRMSENDLDEIVELLGEVNDGTYQVQ